MAATSFSTSIRREKGGRRRLVVELGIPGPACKVFAWFTIEPIELDAVLLERPGVRPSDLQRFPWRRWLTVADAVARQHLREPGAGHSVRKAAERALGVEQPEPRHRPGPKPRDPAFYAGIAEKYEDHRAGGSTAPTTAIARQHHVSRNTAAGWVRRARQLGYLTPARPGRAG